MIRLRRLYIALILALPASLLHAAGHVSSIHSENAFHQLSLFKFKPENPVIKTNASAPTNDLNAGIEASRGNATTPEMSLTDSKNIEPLDQVQQLNINQLQLFSSKADVSPEANLTSEI